MQSGITNGATSTETLTFSGSEATLLDLQETNDDQIKQIASKVAGCGKAPVFFHCNCGFKTGFISCNQYRVCTRCARKRFFAVQRKLVPAMNNLLKGRGSRTNLRLITLTQKNFKNPNLAIDSIHEGFKRLKQRKWWQKRVYSYVAAIEPKLQSTGLWHVHIHIVAYCVFIPTTTLSVEWRTATTGAGYIVDVSKSVTNVYGAVNHLMNYITKRAGASLNQYLIQIIMKGRRLLITGGQFHKKHSNCVLETQQPVRCERCGSNYTFIHPCDYHLYDWILKWYEDGAINGVSEKHRQSLNKWIAP